MVSKPSWVSNKKSICKMTHRSNMCWKGKISIQISIIKVIGFARQEEKILHFKWILCQYPPLSIFLSLSHTYTFVSLSPSYYLYVYLSLCVCSSISPSLSLSNTHTHTHLCQFSYPSLTVYLYWLFEHS